jgi:iron complex outermembrane receptor protein
MTQYWRWVSLGIFLFVVSSLHADTAQLAKLSWGELLDLEVIPVVSSVARKPEKAPLTPAAVFVLTSEDIRRSGATCVPEVLRLVPGLNVSRLDESTWSISARGFGSRFSRTLLVLIDGRSVYSPLESGVYWDVQDLLLEDVERIEVVRGPGGTTWGANAVNGIINIVTKSSHATVDSLATLGLGTFSGTDFGFRQGVKVDETHSYRFSFKGFSRDSFHLNREEGSPNSFDQKRFGFRADWEPSEDRQITVDGSTYAGESQGALILRTANQQSSTSGSSPNLVSGGHLRMQMTQTPRPEEEFRLQFYFDRAQRSDLRHEELFKTFDLDFQHSFSWQSRHELVWGLGYRALEYSLQGSQFVRYKPDGGVDVTRSCFVQDKITLQPRRLFLTLGTKVYHHPYVGTENQPSARILWTPREKHVFWTAFTEARRIPSISERAEVFFDKYRDPVSGKPTIVERIGNPALASEEMKAGEVGYRFLPDNRLSLDLAYFKHVYCNLAQPPASQKNPQKNTANTIQQAGVENSGNEKIHGFELTLEWKPTRKFRFSGGHTVNWLLSPGSDRPIDVSPQHWFLRTSWDPRPNLEVDVSFKHGNAIDVLSEGSGSRTDSSGQSVAAVEALDARIGFRPRKGLELTIGGTSLLKAWHQEFPTQFDFLPTRIPRNYYLKATWHF